MGAKPPRETPEERGRRQLQEVYSALDKGPGGTARIAYYGQLRAMERTHAEALHGTRLHFGL